MFHRAGRRQKATKIKWLCVAALTGFGAFVWCVVRPLLQDYGRDQGAQRAIVSEVQDLVEACRATNVSNPDVIGKALVWNLQTDSPSAAQALLSDELRLASAEETRRLRTPCTVFMIVAERHREVGTLTGQPMYQREADVAVAHWPERKAAGFFSVSGSPPRGWRIVRPGRLLWQRLSGGRIAFYGPQYGGDPSEALARRIEMLQYERLHDPFRRPH